MKPFYQLPAKRVLKELDTNEKGLARKEVQKRQKKFGKNAITKHKETSIIRLFLYQFKSFLIYILIGAVLVAFLAGEYVDALAILVILILNAILGFVQEYKAERAIEALQKLASLTATVLRDGARQQIDATEVVPGDIIILESGDKIPADARIIENYSMAAMESPLTGESVPVRKSIDAINKRATVGDRKNMLYAGTTLTQGRGRAVVVHTGMDTQLGQIAGLVHEAASGPTPLQRRLQRFGKWLGGVIILICLIVFGAGVTYGLDWLEMLIAAVSLAVAAVPEGLPAVVTITLAIGVQQMVKRKALIRKLPAVETLGSCNVICSDKTGTLTHDQMTVTNLYVDREVVPVTGSGYGTEGEVKEATKNTELLLHIGLHCNNAKIDYNDHPKLMGDPTEGALLVSAYKAGLDKSYEKFDEVPFSSERMMMSTIHKKGGKYYVFTKGAVDAVLKHCTKWRVGNKTKKLTRKDKAAILQQNERFAGQALRVLAFAYKEGKGKKIEENLTFVGLQGMIDPPRDEAIEAIKICKHAGIKVVMITGDHKSTAVAIAERMGISGEAIDGDELSEIQDLPARIQNIGVYARVAPAQKVKIVDAFKNQGYVVAMTGDGVNDAPALKQADIGVAMGIKGTDVSKEASDMIILDDNFASIVAAIEKGRNIFDNIQKFVEYLLSCNLGEVLVIFLGILLGYPLPLVAIQILWMNLLTDGLPALALGMEPAEPDLMAEAPQKKQKIIESDGQVRIGVVAGLMVLGTLGVFIWGNPEQNLTYARTLAFTTLVLFQLFQAISCRSLHKSLFRIGWFSNKWMWGALALSLGLQVAIIQTPLNQFFSTAPLTLIDWFIAGAIASSVLVVREIGTLTGMQTGHL